MKVGITAWIHRDNILHELKTVVPSYDKGTKGMFEKTKALYPTAKARAVIQRNINTRLPGDAIYTDADKLVEILLNLVPKP